MFACPVCWSALGPATNAAGFACAVCRETYPYLPRTTIPLLVAGRAALVRDSALALGTLERGAAMVQGALEARLARQAPRAAAVERMRTGLESARDLFRRWLADCAELAGHAVAPAPEPGAGLDVDAFNAIFRSLVLDWSHRPDTEAMIATKVEAIRATLDAAADRRRLVVLGAGMARVASELAADFDEVIAIDLALHDGFTFGALQRGPLELHEPIFTDVERIVDLCPAIRLELGPRAANLHYVVGNALRAPVPAGTASAVLLDYFLDIVPVTPLLRECRRLLAPGGALVSFGPLGYSSYADLDDRFTAEELRDVLPQHGFRLVHDRFVRHAFWPSAMLIERHVRGWSFAAVRDPALG